MNPIKVYTDGACSGNPGKGGWAFAIIERGEVAHSEYGLDEMTTNNRMELTAIIRSLEYISAVYGEKSQVMIHTDSAYCLNAMKDWVHGWKRKGWRKADGKPIENQELMQQLDELCHQSQLSVSWQKVKAHQKPTSPAYDPFNDFVDRLATKHL